MKKDEVDLKVDLLCKGARISEEGWGAYKRSAGFQIYLDETYVSVPAWGKFKRYKYVENSPYLIIKMDSNWMLYRDGKELRSIDVHHRPKFYDKSTQDGVKMWRIFHVCGNNCILTGVQQTCSYMKGGRQCKFCGTIFNPRYEGRLDKKTPEQLAEVAEEGLKEGMKDVMLSSGVTKTPDRGVYEVARAARAIKDRVDVSIQAEVAVPEDVKILEEFSGCIDSISINVETFNQGIREQVCPDKSVISYEDYFKAFELSIDLFGENQVNSWLIAGIGESDESILSGAKMLSEVGVFPMLVALRPTKFTAFENLLPPSNVRLGGLSRKVADMVKDAGIQPRRNKAGCMRCSACSPVKDYVYL
jgi:radical SAM protein (TIGR04043 family)